MAEEAIDPFVIPTLETERLRLRSLRRGDIDDYAAMNADPEVMRHVGGTWDRSRSWRHLAFLIGHWPLGGSGMWAVESKETGAFVGIVGFAEPEGWPGFELAVKLARRWWGYGYATEAARAALAHAFTVLRKDRVISLVRPENRASIRLVERLGERLEGRIVLAGTEYLVYGISRRPSQPGAVSRPQAAVRPPQAAACRASASSRSGRRPCRALDRDGGILK